MSHPSSAYVLTFLLHAIISRVWRIFLLWCINIVTDSGEFNLLDLPRLQTDIERLLASVTQCMTCISNELKGKSIPTPILRSVGLVDADPNNRPTHPSEMTHIGGEPTHAQATSNCSPLSVTANPDKPLSLIISSNKKQSPESSTADAEGFPKASTSRSNEVCLPVSLFDFKVPQSSFRLKISAKPPYRLLVSFTQTYARSLISCLITAKQTLLYP